MATQMLDGLVIVDEDHSISTKALNEMFKAKSGGKTALVEFVGTNGWGAPTGGAAVPLPEPEPLLPPPNVLARREQLRMILHTLERAKQRLLVNGWVQKAGRDNFGRICLGAALETGSTLGALTARRVSGMVGMDIPAWNDLPSRTFDEVIGLLDKAILATLDELVMGA